MSKDIRSYFMAGAKKKPQPPKVEESPQIKRKAVVISSDEEEVATTPKPAIKPSRSFKKKRRLSDSDDEPAIAKESKRKPNLKKLSEKTETKNEPKKVVNVSSLFNSEPTRVERPKSKKETVSQEDKDQLLDDDFDASIAGLDEKQLEDIQPESSHNSHKKRSKSKERSPKNEKEKRDSDFESPKKLTPKKSTTPRVTPAKDSDIHKREIKKTALSDLGLNVESSAESEASNSPNKKEKAQKKADLESSVLTDEERHERKRMAAVLYQKYKNRQAVINPGSKEVPKGKPNCLAGLSFLVTGVLESIDRDEANTVIKDLGGKVSSTVGKRLNYLIVGEDAGPKKLAVAQEMGITIISEDDLFNLIREKSGQVDTNQNATKISPKKEENRKNKSPANEKKPVKHKMHDSEQDKDEKKPKLHDEQKPKIKVEKSSPSPTKKMKTESFANASEDLKPITVPKVEVGEESLAWVDKYKPNSIKQIIGQQGAASNCVKLLNWLSKWHSNHDGKKKLQRPNPWAKNDDGSFYKAALLSGPPGVGKTTTATLVCKELGFDTVEFNASDTRSKKLLKEEVSELLSNKSLYGYFHGDKKTSKNHVLVMDEVDGMAGNEDRGGIQELIALIKDSSVPIICMCNDRNHQKMRSLVNYCYDLRFNRPRVEQIKGAMMSVCFKEKLKIAPNKMEEIITATNNDIRQTLNHLSLLSAGKDLDLGKEEEMDKTAKKDLKLGPWEVVRKVFSADEHKNMSINDKSDLFFHDYSLNPLFVQENYLSVLPKVPKSQIPQQVALTANSLSLGDMIDKRIRSSSAWSLLPVQAMFCSVMPGEYMEGHFTGQINFPGWLGKNSKRNKRSRLAQELHDHTRIRTSGSRLSIRLDYAPFLLDAIVRPLKNRGLDGVHDALEVIKEYRLLREDLESLIELTSWPGKKNPMDSIDGKVKAALTRAYNKEVMPYSYSVLAGVKKKRAEAQDDMEILEEGDDAVVVVDDEEGDDDKLENDTLIKAKKRPVEKGTKAEKGAGKGEAKKGGAGTSKTKAGGSKSKK